MILVILIIRHYHRYFISCKAFFEITCRLTCVRTAVHIAKIWVTTMVTFKLPSTKPSGSRTGFPFLSKGLLTETALTVTLLKLNKVFFVNVVMAFHRSWFDAVLNVIYAHGTFLSFFFLLFFAYSPILWFFFYFQCFLICWCNYRSYLWCTCACLA